MLTVTIVNVLQKIKCNYFFHWPELWFS